MRHSYAIALLIFLNIVVFGQTATFDFVAFDDHTYLLNNPQFKDGLTFENIRWSFTTGYFVNWHPITWLSFFLDNQLYGMDARGYHVTNVIIHILASILIYLALFRMTKKTAESLIVAILFAIHPQHVQSVAWISERKDVLSAFFMGLALLAYHKYTVSKEWRWYCVTALVYALGLMSKPMLVTLPCILLLLDHWPLNRLSTRPEIIRSVLEKLPLLLLAVISSIVTFMAQNNGGATSTIEAMGIIARVAVAANAYTIYLLRTVWPINLTFFYPLVISRIPYDWAIFSGVILILISIFVWRFRKSAPTLAVGWLWYLGMLVPVSGLVQVGGQSSADRYTYIPLIGIFVAIVYTVYPWFQKSPIRVKLSQYGIVIIIVACTFLSFKETYFWKDSPTLAGHGIVIREDNQMAYKILGNYYFFENNMPQAEEFYRKYYALDPNDLNVQLRLGTTLQEQGKYNEAEEMLLGCTESFPENAMANFNMGILMGKQGKNNDANEWYMKAIELDDSDPKFYINYGNLLAQSGDLNLALKQYDYASELTPDDATIYHNRASALYFHGQNDQALKSVQHCLAMDQSYEPARLLLSAIEREILSTK
jgi:protein O-mannosyl-transferase